MKRFILSALVVVSAPIAVQGQAPTAEPGFTPIFDGKTLDGWQGGKEGYAVQDGAIVSQPKGSRNLATVKEYGDFDLKFEFKLTPGANNGIGIRVPTEEEG